MLYDPKWEVQTKADPLSLSAFIAWVERQPGDQRYDFYDCSGTCLLCQYLTAAGLDYVDKYGDLFGGYDARNTVAASRPHTFGAALERARALVK